MTRPDLMVAAQRAAAIVTDVGGLLCHAAIVAREWGIPCVVGTKTATSRIEDGQTVILSLMLHTRSSGETNKLSGNTYRHTSV